MTTVVIRVHLMKLFFFYYHSSDVEKLMFLFKMCVLVLRLSTYNYWYSFVRVHF